MLIWIFQWSSRSKNFFIFAVGTFTAVKLFGNWQNEQSKKHLYFNWNGDIYKILDNTPQWGFFLVADNGVGYEPIDFKQWYRFFISYYPFAKQKVKTWNAKKQLLKLLLTGLLQIAKLFAYQKSLKDVFYAKGQFACVTNKKFLKFYDYLDNEIELESFLGSISIAIKTLLQRNLFISSKFAIFQKARRKTVRHSKTL